MATKDAIVDLDRIDLHTTLRTIDDIRRHNPQRFEMEQLSGILHEDPDAKICVGFKDLAADEFWVRGHMPGMPLLPGVLICEAAAQLASYFVQKLDLLGVKMVGFGGMDGVRFRGVVRPGDRLIVACQLTRIRRRGMIVCRFQAFVEKNLVAEGEIRGIPLPEELLAEAGK